KRSIWVSWNKVLTSKEKGGLGVSSLFALNRECLNGFGDFLIKVTRYGLGSFTLYMELMVGLVEREMSDIHRKWVEYFFLGGSVEGEQRLKEVFSCIYALEVNKHISVAFKFEQTALFSSLRRMPRSGIESEQWDHLLDSLEGVMLNPSEDRWPWDLNGSGEFSVASAPRYIDNNRLPDISSKTR
nr:RNA-directed DNA polymerase, eukaryota, reverse transcriptase zinc-binding domain protein [Tanacetum cinerariifolium]